MSLNDSVAAEGRVRGLLRAPGEEALGPRGGGQVQPDHLLGARRQDLVVQLMAVVRVLGHEEAAVHQLQRRWIRDSSPLLCHSLTHLVLGRALGPLLGLGVVLGAEAVHQLVHEVEHAHPQRDPLLLAALQRDEQRVEAVRVLVRP